MAPPVITVTRQYGSGGSDIARLVAERLGWELVDNQFVEEVARRAGVPPAEVAQREERAPGLLERLARTLAVASPEMFIAQAAVPRVEQDEATLVKITERVIAEAATHGRVVLVGRAQRAGGRARDARDGILRHPVHGRLQLDRAAHGARRAARPRDEPAHARLRRQHAVRRLPHRLSGRGGGRDDGPARGRGRRAGIGAGAAPVVERSRSWAVAGGPAPRGRTRMRLEGHVALLNGGAST